MVIRAPFATQRRSSSMARRDKLWLFYTFHHPEAASPMTGGDKLRSFAHLSPSRDNRVRWHAETNYGHSAPFVMRRRRARQHAEKNYVHPCTFHHSETIESGGTESQIMVILHLLSSRGGEPDDMGRQIMVIHTTFRHPETIESDGTLRKIIVILHLLSSRGGEPDDMRRQIMVICTF